MKFNVGDKVRIKENLNECEFGCNSYMRNFIGEKATVMNIFRDNILLDIDGQMWYWSENVLELIKNKNDKIKRIDYILNSKDPIKVLIEEFNLEGNCCVCPGLNYDCEERCDYYLKQYLEQEIEVNKSDLKGVDAKETLQETLDEVKEPVENDNVNHPSHYTDGNIEVMDFIEDKQLNFAKGNVIKYVSRAGKKDPNKELEDLKKAMWYLNREIERLKELQGENNE